MVEIRRLTASDKDRYVPDLATILMDCIDGGASVSFMAGMTGAEAEEFFDGAFSSRIVLAAFDGSNMVGTVQVVTDLPPNQPHRAEIAKLLVLRSARGQGVASRLMEAAEQHAREAGKTLLVLDTVTGGDAERLYARLGWTKAGVIPNYAMFPDGRFASTTFFWKELR